MSSIQDIANLMGDDDEIKESALTTAAIPIAPRGTSGFEKSMPRSVKKKKKPKKKEHYSADSSGQPLKGEVLFAGEETEEHIEEAEEEQMHRRPQKRLGRGDVRHMDSSTKKKKKRKRKPYVSAKKRGEEEKDKTIWAPSPKWATVTLPKVFHTGGIESLGRDFNIEDAKELTRTVESSPKLNSAKNELLRIIGIIRPHWSRSSEVHRLLADFSTIESMRKGDPGSQPVDNAWETGFGYGGGLGMGKPSTGWWGIRNWGRADVLDRYKRIYINQVYFKYIKRVRELLNEHIQGGCDDVCEQGQHVHYLMNGYKGGFPSDEGDDWTLGSAVKEMSLERQQDFNVFSKRARGRIRPEDSELTKRSTARAKEIRDKEGVEASLEKVDPYSDPGHAEMWRKFFGIKDPVKESKSPLEISKMIEDSDDTSL